MVEEVSCPKCKTTKYRDPSLKLMVNVCGHGLCENCVKLLFIKGSGPCPHDGCDLTLRKSDFRYQVFENAYVEKDVDIRKKILKDFNKKEDDFDNLKDYNDYLELVETIIYNLANNIDVENTKKRVEAYKKENQEIIAKNRTKKSKDELLIEDLIEEEKELDAFRRNHHNLLLEKEQLAKVKKHQQEKLIDDLMYSEADAKDILDSHAEVSKKRIEAVQERIIKDEEEKRLILEQQITSIRSSGLVGKFSSGIAIGAKMSAAANVQIKQQNEILDIYKFENLEVESRNGPTCPTGSQLQSAGFLKHVTPNDKDELDKWLAGGFIPSYPCLRAIQESFCELYFNPEATHNE